MIPQSDTGTRSRQALAAFAALASVYFLSYVQRVAVPGMIFDELQADFKLSASGVTALGSLFALIYGGMQIVVGLLVDAYGGRRSLMGGGLAMVMGAAAFSLATSVPTLFLARGLAGFGASFIFLGTVEELSLFFDPDHLPAVLGAILSVGYFGAMAATLPFERAVAAIGWRSALLALALLMFVLLVLSFWVTRTAGRPKGVRTSISLLPLRDVFTNKSCRPLIAGSLLSFPVYFVVGTMLGKKFLQDAGGMSSPHSAAFMLGMTATSALAALTGGVLPRLFGNRRRPCILLGSGTLLFSVALLLAGTVLHAPNWVYLIAYILLAAAGIGSPSSFATMKDLGKSGSFASGISVLNALSYIGSGIIGQICGMILDLFHSSGGGMAAAGSYPPSAFIVLFVFLCALAFIFFLLTLTIVETGGTGLRPRPEGKS